jgi:hypothetical protein
MCSFKHLVIELGGVAQVVESSRRWQRSTTSCSVRRRLWAAVSDDAGELRCLATPTSCSFRRRRQAAVSGDADELQFLVTLASCGVRRHRRAAVSSDAGKLWHPAVPRQAVVSGDAGQLRSVSAG